MSNKVFFKEESKILVIIQEGKSGKIDQKATFVYLFFGPYVELTSKCDLT